MSMYDEHDNKTIPYIAFESELARMERVVKRLILTILLLMFMLFASNVAWLIVFNQYDFTVDTVTLDSGENGTASYIGANGVINNGQDRGEEGDS